MKFKKKIDDSRVWLIAIVLLALLVRFYGLNFGAPFNYHPDETKLVTQAGRLLATKFMDKEAYFGINVYPPFYTYLLAMLMGGYIGFGLLTGHFASLAAVRMAYDHDPFQFFLLSRSLVAVLGVLSVLLIYAFGKRLYSKQIGGIAALLLAVNFLYVRNSHFGTVDIPAAFLGLACLYFCVHIFQRGQTVDYILAAVFAALSTATKFNMVLLLFPFLFAHFAQPQSSTWAEKFLDKKLWLAAGVGIVSFLVACPLIWLDFHETWGGILGTSRFEKIGKIGSGGGVLSYWTGDQSDGFGVFYPNSLPETFGLLLTLLAAAGLFFLIFKHRRQDVFLLVCVIPMYLLFEKMSIKAMRHILPIIPLLLLAATVFMTEMTQRIRKRSLRLAVLSTIVIYLSITQLYVAISYQRALLQQDPRTLATGWIQEHMKSGNAVAVESFPPLLFSQDDHGFKIYETNWTAKTLAKRQEFFAFASEVDSLYYIADDFTRQTFSWKFTKEKYPDITKDRVDFFAWLEKNAEKRMVFKSQNPKIQPTITVYLLKAVYE